MNQYHLRFIDPKVENLYQQQQQSNSRSAVFKMMSFGLMITFAIRVMYGLIEKTDFLFFYKLAMLLYLILQYIMVQWQPQLTRMAFFITNICTMGLVIEEESSPEVQNLKGANLMTVNIMLVLSGEFFDSVIQLILITTLRLSLPYITTNSQNYMILTSTILANSSFLFYAYTYHKAMRSQYLLGLVESSWDKIFYELIKDPYILLKFSYSNLNFSVQKENRFPFKNSLDFDEDIQQCEQEERTIRHFLQNASLGKTSLSEYIYGSIKKFQMDCYDHFNQILRVRFKRQLLQIEMSIFQAKNPMILLRINSINKHSIKQLRKYKKRFILYNNTIINLLSKIEKETKNNIIVKETRRKLILVKLIEELYDHQYSFNTVNLQFVIQQIENLYPDKNILFQNTNKIETLFTIPNALFMLLLSVFENSDKGLIECNLIKLKEEMEIMIEFNGNFQAQKILKIYQSTKYHIRLLVSSLFISPKLVQFILFSEPLCSSNLDIYTYEYDDLLSNDR
ncbi:unnamed protein product [Paramecium pentaurelia]|uniref:Transmembrane protein n=1 Tax=Paramecium pentaurelia TaxID=43138 RepID=A0A8S1TQW0_9CILI|nr:unnamed protein product [Paramecium pentaurelia]